MNSVVKTCLVRLRDFAAGTCAFYTQPPINRYVLQVNRKSQTIFHLDDSDSDDDPDLANQSLSQSMMRSNGMLGYSKSFQVCVPESISVNIGFES